jgi:integrase/recombinase XerD
MPYRLSTLLDKLDHLDNKPNASLIKEFYLYMNKNNLSDNHKLNNLRVIIPFSNFLGSKSFFDIKTKNEILEFLDTKIKSKNEDPDGKWITTWNHYLNRIKQFYRWLYNRENDTEQSEWETPNFVRIKNKNTKRINPYLESELWERDDILTLIKYENHKRNKAALALMWDLDGRNHEITSLKLKHIKLKEKYGEGEIPFESKTGTGPILLTLSFPYVRDWLNEHPFKNEPNASLICSLVNGSPINPEALWTMIQQLRKRIVTMVDMGFIKDDKENEKLNLLLSTKRWNPYCIRHSAITNDSDHLPEYALKKKVRWSMNSKQGVRYIKRRMGNELKAKILEYNGIITSDSVSKKPSVLNCPRCELTNALENLYCSKCSYPLKPMAFDEIKQSEEHRFKELEEKYENGMKQMKEDIENKLQQIMAKIDITRV